MTATIAFGRHIALLVATCLSLAVTLGLGLDIGEFVTLCSGTCAAALLLGRIRTRTKLIYVGLAAGAIVTLTHDPKLDDPALEVALKSDAFYIGSLGSRRTHASRLERLTEAGFTEQDTARINAPIGLDLGSASPAEIAVSVLAQIIAAKHGKLGPE